MKRLFFMGLLLAALLMACGGAEPDPTPEPPLTEAVDEAGETPTGAVEPEAEPTEPVPTEEPVEETAVYEGVVTEMAIRRLNQGQDVAAFAAARDGYVSLLREQAGTRVDREFVAFLDFMTGAEPTPPVYIGMTQYDDLAAFTNAVEALSDVPETADFIDTFSPEVFGALRPLNPEDVYELGDILTEPGQMLEIAVRDLSAYADFDQVAYETARDAFLAALSQQAGVVAEYQWVSLLDSNIVVGMTVYESVDAYFAIYGGEFGQADVTQTFGGTYPVLVGYASFDARVVEETAVSEPVTFSFGEQVSLPETIAVHDGFGFTSNFFDGTISKIDLATGETVTLVEAGNDGVIAGWGLWYDRFSAQLLACATRNAGFGSPEINNAARAIEPQTGDILETWELPATASCNSILAVESGDIYLSDVSPSADIIKIDRATGEATIWIDEPSWENDSGFGVGGLAWDGANTLYASIGGLVRIPINEDGTPGDYATMNMVDAAGNPIMFSFDGFAYSEETGKLYGASFDFEAFVPQIVEVTILDEETAQAEVVATNGISITGIDTDGDFVYAADGQLIPLLFGEDYEPVVPFQLFQIPIQSNESR